MYSADLIRMADGAILALSSAIRYGMERHLEPKRLAKAGYAILKAGVSPSSPFPGKLLGNYLISEQQSDGGWADVDETAWCIGFLEMLGDNFLLNVESAKAWLRSQRLSAGGWGLSDRDRPRLPVSGILSALMPDIVDSDLIDWAAHEWSTDLHERTPLSYKGAFFLIIQSAEPRWNNEELIIQTVKYIAAQQEEDGGFAPWKGHPIGSDPWSTGAVLWGLSRFSQDVHPSVFKAATAWLGIHQRQDGYWPYHYLDDGTAMALIGLTSILPFIPD